MYNSSSWSALIEGCTTNTDPNAATDHAVHYKTEYNALLQLSNHPWRVYEPEEALIFVIPLMLGTASRGLCHLNSQEISKRATSLLLKSEFFNRYKGSDHLLINSDWRVRSVSHPLESALKNAIFGIQEHYKNERRFHIERCDIAVPYGGEYDYSENNSDDLYKEFVSKKYNTFFIGQISTKWAYADRYHGFLHSDDNDFQKPHIFATFSNSKCRPHNIY